VIIHYLDASAWVKRYAREAGSEWLANLFEGWVTFTCASLGFIEVLAALHRRRKGGDLQEPDFDAALRAFQEDRRRFIEVQLTSEVMEVADEVVRRFGLRGADTVHLASALVVRRRFEGETVTVVTSDCELNAAAQAAGFIVLDPVNEEQKAAGGSQR
jgi:predicted nucleic acid-binding protein